MFANFLWPTTDFNMVTVINMWDAIETAQTFFSQEDLRRFGKKLKCVFRKVAAITGLEPVTSCV
jgi:hypothetical protein